MIWSVHEGRGRTPFMSTEGHEGPRRKPLRDHKLVCPRRAGENTFFDPRRATKDHEENLCGIMIWSSTKGGGEHLLCPRRATKDHGENLCGIMIWSVHEGRGRTPFMSTEGHEGPRRKPLRDHKLVCPRRAGENTFYVHGGPRRTTRKPLRDHDLVCPRRAGENTFLDPRRATKDHGENLCGIMIWSVHEGRGRTPFLIHEGPRRTTEKTFAGS